MLEKIELSITPKGNPVVDLSKMSFIGVIWDKSMPKLLLYETEDNAIFKPHRGMLLVDKDGKVYRMLRLCRQFEGDLEEAKQNGTIQYQMLIAPSEISIARIMELNMKGRIKL